MRTRSLVVIFLLVFLSVPLIAADDQNSEVRAARLQAQANAQAAKGVVAAVLVFNGARLDVLAYSFGASNSGSFSNEGGAAVGKVNFQDLSIVRYVGAGSQELFRAVATGTPYTKATLEMVNAKGAVVAKLELTNVLVSSYQGGAGSEVPTESVSFTAGKIEYILIGL